VLETLLLALTLQAAPVARVAGVPATAKPDSLLPTDPAVKIGTLPNGLRYYIRTNRKPEHRAELRLVVNAGSVLEDDDQRGLAHFVEHMAFNGTTNFEKQELIDYIERIGMRFGADLNAGTSFDETVYQLQVPTDSAGFLGRAFQILEDWAHGVTFDTTEIRKERGVVLEEWRMGRGARQRLLDQQLPVLFHGSRYAHRLPIGTQECIQQCPPEALTRFYREWYRPDLMAVVAVGDFDPARVESLIRQHFGKLRNPARPRRREAVPMAMKDSATVAIATDPEATGTSVSVYYQLAPRGGGSIASRRERLIEELGTTILNQRLFELTRRSDPPFIGAGASRSNLVRSADVFAFGASVPDSGVRRGLEAVLTEIERAGRHGFTAPELERAKQEFLRGLEQVYAEREKSESSSFVDDYVDHFLTGDGIPGIEDDYRRAQAWLPQVRIEELNALARSWLTGAPVILVDAPAKNRALIPVPEELLALFTEIKRRPIEPYRETVSAEALVPAGLTPGRVVSERRDSVAKTLEWTLANGIRVVLKPTTHKDDELLFQAWTEGGTSLASDSALPSAQISAQVVGVSGLGEFDAIALGKKLAGKAVALNPYVGSYEHGLSGRASSKDAETLLQLAWLHFMSPRYDSAAVNALLGNLRAVLANRSASPQVAFSDTLSVTLTQHHPRNRPITPAFLDRVRPEQAYAFYRERFADPAAFTFFLVGTFNPDSMKPLVERYLGSLPGREGRVEQPVDHGIRGPEGVVERTVHKGLEPRSQTAIVFTGPMTWSREEAYALQALGEVLSIRLREALREELGGTYGVNVGASASRRPREAYTLSISFGSSPGRVDSLVREVFAQIDSIRQSGPPAGDLVKVREAAIRERETNLERNGFWLEVLLSARRQDRPAGDFLSLDPLLARLNAETLQAAARRYLDPGRFVRVTLLPENRGTP
jgi:zinc protease